jgi:hypothetical protein
MQILTQMLYASRFVPHRDVSREDIDTFVDAVGVYLHSGASNGPDDETGKDHSQPSRNEAALLARRPNRWCDHCRRRRGRTGGGRRVIDRRGSVRANAWRRPTRR